MQGSLGGARWEPLARFRSISPPRSGKKNHLNKQKKITTKNRRKKIPQKTEKTYHKNRVKITQKNIRNYTKKQGFFYLSSECNTLPYFLTLPIFEK